MPGHECAENFHLSTTMISGILISGMLLKCLQWESMDVHDFSIIKDVTIW